MWARMFPVSVAILGPGLLGGSLALDLSAAGVEDLRLWARRSESLKAAARLGINARLTDSLDVAVAGAGLVVLATPVGVMPDLAARIASAAAKPAIVTDMGSVKAMIEEHVAPVLRQAGIAFVGAHPMCGSEKKGISAAFPGMFSGAACILTPRDGETRDVLAVVEGFWRALGCRLIGMTPSAHDEAVARISHLPHLAAAILAAVAVGNHPGALALAAGGFRDSTRVAGGPPDMWTEILLENRQAVLPLLRQLAAAIGAAASSLEAADATALQAILTAGRDARAPLADTP